MSKSVDKRPSRTTADEPIGLEEAFARWQPQLLGALVCLLGNAEDARDALQEAFVKCWRNQHLVAEVQNLRAWIYRIVLNTGRDMRGAAWRRRRQALPEDESLVEGRDENPTSILETHEEAQRVWQAVRQLRPEQQEVFLLRQNGEMTYEEIAVAMNIPTGTVKTRMRLALIRLREVLAEEPT